MGALAPAPHFETEADRAKLLELGCSRMQGHLFARPIGEPAFIEYLEVPGRSPRSAR